MRNTRAIGFRWHSGAAIPARPLVLSRGQVLVEDVEAVQDEAKLEERWEVLLQAQVDRHVVFVAVTPRDGLDNERPWFKPLMMIFLAKGWPS